MSFPVSSPAVASFSYSYCSSQTASFFLSAVSFIPMIMAFITLLSVISISKQTISLVASWHLSSSSMASWQSLIFFIISSILAQRGLEALQISSFMSSGSVEFVFKGSSPIIPVSNFKYKTYSGGIGYLFTFGTIVKRGFIKYWGIYVGVLYYVQNFSDGIVWLRTFRSLNDASLLEEVLLNDPGKSFALPFHLFDLRLYINCSFPFVSIGHYKCGKTFLIILIKL